MAANITLATIRTRLRTECDLTNDNSLTDTELNTLINAGAREVYDLLVQAFGGEWYLTSANFNTVAGTSDYALATIAASFYLLKGVDLSSSGRWVKIEPFSLQTREHYQSATLTANGWSGQGYVYRLSGTNLTLAPTPSAVQTVRVWYVPAFTALSADGDNFDGINGWEEGALVSAGRKIKAIREEDPSAWEQRWVIFLQRLEAIASQRQAGDPQTIRITQNVDLLPRW